MSTGRAGCPRGSRSRPGGSEREGRSEPCGLTPARRQRCCCGADSEVGTKRNLSPGGGTGVLRRAGLLGAQGTGCRAEPSHRVAAASHLQFTTLEAHFPVSCSPCSLFEDRPVTLLLCSSVAAISGPPNRWRSRTRSGRAAGLLEGGQAGTLSRGRGAAASRGRQATRGTGAQGGRVRDQKCGRGDIWSRVHTGQGWEQLPSKPTRVAGGALREAPLRTV